MSILNVTPILIVEAIEPCLPFWEALGFEPVAEVHEDERLGFVLLSRGSVSIMYQTEESVEADIPAVARLAPHQSVLYLRVIDVETIASQIIEAEVVVPLRTTPYGSREIFVREPGGHVVAFAEFTGETE